MCWVNQDAAWYDQHQDFDPCAEITAFKRQADMNYDTKYKNLPKYHWQAPPALMKVCVGFSMLSKFLGRILMEYIESICSLESKLFLISICSIRNPSRNRDIFEKLQHISDPT